MLKDKVKRNVGLEIDDLWYMNAYDHDLCDDMMIQIKTNVEMAHIAIMGNTARKKNSHTMSCVAVPALAWGRAAQIRIPIPPAKTQLPHFEVIKGDALSHVARISKHLREGKRVFVYRATDAYGNPLPIGRGTATWFNPAVEETGTVSILVKDLRIWDEIVWGGCIDYFALLPGGEIINHGRMAG